MKGPHKESQHHWVTIKCTSLPNKKKLRLMFRLSKLLKIVFLLCRTGHGSRLFTVKIRSMAILKRFLGAIKKVSLNQ